MEDRFPPEGPASEGPAGGGPEHVSIQDQFLDYLRQNQAAVTIFLVNGVKLQGVVPAFDGEVLVLRRDGHAQLVYKHAISTIMPLSPVPGFGVGQDSGTAAG
ncbi:RNA chaperone Hfq [Acidomonas methanolica]|nr:RNA chaperone Hfq [Acidomonas methanolica]